MDYTRFCVSAHTDRVLDGIEEVFRVPNPQITFIRFTNETKGDNPCAHDIIGNRFPALDEIEITELRPCLSDLEKLGRKCPQVKKLNFENIHPATEEICNCRIDR